MTGWLVVFLGVIVVGWLASFIHAANKQAYRKPNLRHNEHDNLVEDVKTPEQVARGG